MRQRLQFLFDTQRPGCAVSSAACGADLIGLEMAEQMGVRRLVVLPFEKNAFRETSVADRGGDWGIRFDRVMDTLPSQDLIVLNLSTESADAYAQANRAILDQAMSVANDEGGTAAAIVIWDGKERPGDDITWDFVSGARSRGMRVEEVLTL